MLFYLALYLIKMSSAEREKVSSGCGKVKLTCETDEMIVVKQAAFIPRGDCTKIDMDDPRSNNQDIWRAIVKTCNGVREGKCIFDLGVNLPGSEGWGVGRTDVRYSCVGSVNSYCGGRVDEGRTGYIASPGYPRYYLGGRECIWNLVVEKGQTMKIQVKDLDLREAQETCEDSVMVKEEGRTLLTACGVLLSPMSVVSETGRVEIHMRTGASKQQLYAKRGLLLQYAVLGCPDPTAIAEGTVSRLNSTQVLLQCTPDHLFVSTLNPRVILNCDSDTLTWIPAVEHCVSLQWLLQYSNSSTVKRLSANYMKLKQKQRSGKTKRIKADF